MKKANQEYKFEIENGLTNKTFKEWLNQKKSTFYANAEESPLVTNLNKIPISYIGISILVGLLIYIMYSDIKK